MAGQPAAGGPVVAGLGRVSDVINQATQYTIAGMMAAMTVIIALQVFFRYVLNDALSWTEEIARYLMIWICFLGSAMALKYGEHISVTFLQDRFPPRLRQVVGLTMGLAVLGFFLLGTWEGVLMTLQVADQQAPATWISMAWAYACIPVGCSFMTIHTLLNLIRFRCAQTAAASAGERPL
jgi:TRAP-type C4-dicarboxylate transport system permease small subunit